MEALLLLLLLEAQTVAKIDNHAKNNQKLQPNGQRAKAAQNLICPGSASQKMMRKPGQRANMRWWPMKTGLEKAWQMKVKAKLASKSK